MLRLFGSSFFILNVLAGFALPIIEPSPHLNEFYCSPITKTLTATAVCRNSRKWFSSVHPTQLTEACQRCRSCTFDRLQNLFSEFRLSYPYLNISGSDYVEDGQLVWTFAYGSNMNPTKLANWGVYPRMTIPAVLYGYALRFDTKLKAKGEPSFANVIQCPDYSEGCAHGTISLMSREELIRLSESEPMYIRESVSVVTYSGETTTAEIFVCPSEDRETRPSERYARLVYCGAMSANLCPRYIESLKTLLFKNTSVLPNNFCQEDQFQILPLGHFESSEI